MCTLLRSSRRFISYTVLCALTMYLQPGYGTTIDAHGSQFIVNACTYIYVATYTYVATYIYTELVLYAQQEL